MKRHNLVFHNYNKLKRRVEREARAGEREWADDPADRAQSAAEGKPFLSEILWKFIKLMEICGNL